MALIMDSSRLRELTRPQLQSLAKREVVRAVGKTEDIIRRLMRKHPRGVPVSEYADNPSASSAPPLRRSLFKKTCKRTLVAPETSEAHTDPKDEPAAGSAPSRSDSSEALEQLLYPEDEPVAGPSNPNPKSVSAPYTEVTESETGRRRPESVSPSELSPHENRDEDEAARSVAPLLDSPTPDWQGDEELDDEYEYPKGGLTRHIVVDTLRQFTTLANTIPSMKVRIAESRCLLQRTETLLKKATPDARELAVTREYLEVFLLAKMKEKRELWDGTGRMKKEARKFRMEWLRAERKAANEKRWKEANEWNRQHGHELEPFSAFASESDEEVIESLQTTPAGSRDGSCKRSREDSDAESKGDADADTDTDDESERKRARS